MLTEIQLKVLEHIHDLPGQEGDVSHVETHLGEGLLTQFEHLADAGLLRRAIRGDGFYHLTPAGEAEVVSLLGRRENRSYRRRKCREALLSWIDDVTEPEPAEPVGMVVLECFTGMLDGIQFTALEVDQAAEFHVRHALIEATSTLYPGWASDDASRAHNSARVTEKGQRCVDQGDGIAAFLDKSRATADGGFTQHVVVNGSGNNVAAAAGNINQVTATLEAFDLNKASGQAGAIRQALRRSRASGTRSFRSWTRSTQGTVASLRRRPSPSTSTSALPAPAPSAAHWPFRWPKPSDSPDATTLEGRSLGSWDPPKEVETLGLAATAPLKVSPR